MQSRKLLLIGGSLGALINIGTAGAVEAPQSSDSNPARSVMGVPAAIPIDAVARQR
jgi:hypothetical protein